MMNEGDADLKATIREVLADPVARAAYERARAERLSRPAIMTFRRAMMRYEKQARAKHAQEAVVHDLRRARLDDSWAERFAENHFRQNATALRQRPMRKDDPSAAFLYERAADAAAKLRVALEACQ